MKKYYCKIIAIFLATILFVSIFGSFHTTLAFEKKNDEVNFSDNDNAFLGIDSLCEETTNYDYAFKDLLEFIPNYSAGNMIKNRVAEMENNLFSASFKTTEDNYISFVFSEPIKYIDKDGNIKDKGTSITELSIDDSKRDVYYYSNSSNNDVCVYFPEVLNDVNGIMLEKDDVRIELSPSSYESISYLNNKKEAEQSSAQKKKSNNNYYKNEKDTIEYDGVFGYNTSLRYYALLNGFKEDIVINEWDGSENYSFTLKTNGMSMIEEDGRYYLCDARTGDKKVSMGELVVYTNGGEDTCDEYENRYDVIEVVPNEKYTITVYVSKELFEDEETVFPVIIDPSFEVISTGSSIMDISVRANGSVITNSINDGVGNHYLEHNDMRTFIKFPGLLDCPTTGTIAPYGFGGNGIPEISSIKLNMYSRGSSFDTTDVTAFQNNTSNSLNWNYSTPSFTSLQYNALGTELDCVPVPYTGPQWIEFDITGILNSEGEKGIILKNEFEGTGNDAVYQSFASTKDPYNKPFVTVTWTGPENDSFDDALCIGTDILYNVNLTSSVTNRYYSFTPNTTGYYVFESSSIISGDPKCAIYNDSYQLLRSDNNGAGNYNFRMVHHLDSGVEYFFKVFCSGSGTGSFQVSMSECTDLTQITTNTLTIGSNKTGVIQKGYFKQNYSFTPDYTMYYTFSSDEIIGTPCIWVYNCYGLLVGSDNTNGGAGLFDITLKLTAGQTYYIAIGCSNGSTGIYSYTVEDEQPVQPYDLEASGITGNSVNLSWETDDPDWTDRWLIQYKVGNNDWVNAKTSMTKSSYVNGLVASTTYLIRVIGEIGDTPWYGVWSDSSENVSVTTLPAQPTGLSASNITGNGLTLTWNTVTPHGADRWLIQYKVSGGNWQNLGRSTVQTYNVTNLNASTTYSFRVYAERGSSPWNGVWSLPSGTISKTTLPAQPTGLSASNITGNGLTLTWNTVTPHGADRWLIQYKVSGGNWQNLGRSTVQTYNVTNLNASTTYSFRVFAERGSSPWNGVWSMPSGSITKTTLPAQPTGLTASNISSNSLTLNWDTVLPHGADRWLIQYKTSGGSWQNAGTSTVQAYTVIGLNPGTSYQFRVYAERGGTPWSGVRSVVSNTASATTQVNSLQNTIQKIQNSSNIPSEKKPACITVAETLLNEGFELAYVAGLLANICNEGNTGIFEYWNPNTDYLPNLSSYLYANYGYTYQNEYSGQFIYNKNVTTVYNLLQTLNNMSWHYNGARIGMGMGCVGWTFGRAYTLVQTYREVNNNSSSITYAQAMNAEALLVSRELCGGYYYLYSCWCSHNSPSLNTANAAYDAAFLICTEYERPAYDDQAVIRGNLAVLIYNDID